MNVRPVESVGRRMGGVEVDSTQGFSAAANHCSQHFCPADCINFPSAMLSLRVASGVMGRVEKEKAEAHIR